MTEKNADGTTRRARVFVHLDYGRTPAEWRQRFEAGRAWESSPYSYQAAAEAVELSYSTDSRESRLGNLGRRAVAKALGFDLAHAFRNRRRAGRADVVWTHTEREFLALCLLSRLGLLGKTPPKLLAQSVWLYDTGRLTQPLSRHLYLWLMRAVDIEIVHSAVNASAARALPLGRPVYRVPYGSNAFAGNPPPARGARPLVLVPGHDRHRDWATAIAAARVLPELDFRFACQPQHLGALRHGLPANITVGQSARVAELAQLYRASAAVLIPLVPNGHASGLTVAIEAMKNGRRIVSNAVGGLGEYIEPELLVSYDTGDAESLADALREAIGLPQIDLDGIVDPVEARGLRGEDYAARMLLLTGELLTGIHDSRVEQLSPAAADTLADAIMVER